MSPALRILLDTDVLIQILISHSERLLRDLRCRFGIEFLCMQEVELETCNHRRFKAKFESQLSKLLHDSEVRICDLDYLKHSLPGASADSALRGIESRGKEYRLHVGSGEAFTHAAAVELGGYAASNDSNAVRVLEGRGLTCSSPTLRFFDLIVLSHQSGLMPEPACNGIRRTLERNNEALPGAFAHSSFGDGIASFSPRLIDVSQPEIGQVRKSAPGGIAHVIRLAPVAPGIQPREAHP